VRKLLVIGLTILIAGLTFLIASCGSGVRSTVVPSSPSPAVKLAFTAQPVGAAAGSALDTQPVVAVEDAEGNIVTGYRGLVVVTITSGTGASGSHLFGGTTVRLVNGVGEFRGLSVDKAGAGYTLTVTGGTLASAISSTFTISPGAPAKLEFTTQPSGAIAGSPLSTQPQVIVEDSYGNKVTGYEGSVTLAIMPGLSPTGAVLSGTTTARVVNSVAKFTNVSIDKTWTSYKLIATSEPLASAISIPFEISPGAPVKLRFSVQPDGAFAEVPFFTQPIVVVEDIYGNVVTSSSSPVTVTITAGTGAGGALLSGTTTVNAKRGLATFTDLSIDSSGAGYTLTCTSSGLTPATSQTFEVL
jgi:hypothetical protein